MSKPSHPLTAEVKQFANLDREGDVIPHGWNKHIGRWHITESKITGESKKAWRSRPFAERLLARIVWMYMPSPIKNDSGDVVAWRRKFKGPYWQINQGEMAEALGCSRRTVVDELSLLRELGLVRTQETRARTPADGSKHIPIFVIPIYEAVTAITGVASEETSPVAREHSALAASEETSTATSEESSLGASEETSHEPVKKLHNSSIPSSIPSTSIPFSSGREGNAASPPPAKTNPPANAWDKKPPKRKSEPDPRSKHPAIVLVHEITRQYPHLSMYDSVIAALGESPDREKAKACFEQWVAGGRNPRAMTPFTEWYVSGCPPPYVPPAGRTNSNSAPLKGYEKSKANLTETVERIRAMRDANGQS